MANKRMFARTVTDSDVFLDLPLTAQALYFHICMSADDHGFFNNVRTICRTIGATNKDVQALIASGLIIEFDSGVMVVRDWHVNNNLSVKTQDTAFEAEKRLLGGGIVENGKDAAGKTKYKGTPYYLKTDVTFATSQDSLVQNSLVEDSLVENSIEEVTLGENRGAQERIEGAGRKENHAPDYSTEFDELFSNYPNKGDIDKAFEVYKAERERGTSFEEIAEGLVAYADKVGGDTRFYPNLKQWLEAGNWQEFMEV